MSASAAASLLSLSSPVAVTKLVEESIALPSVMANINLASCSEPHLLSRLSMREFTIPRSAHACHPRLAADDIRYSLLFLVSAGLQIALSRSHKREKRYGPSPANNYTSGSGKTKFWARKNRKNRDAELATVGAAGGLVAAEEHHKHNGINGGMHHPAMTGSGMNGDYGGPDNKYATREPTVPGSNTHTATSTMTGYNPQGTGYQSTGYTPQTSGVIGGGDGTSVPEMQGNTHLEGGHMHHGAGPLHRSDLP